MPTRSYGLALHHYMGCQLKPKIRMQTLESLAYTLNHIYLEDRKVKTYEIPESDNNLMAAEPELLYGKAEKTKHP